LSPKAFDNKDLFLQWLKINALFEIGTPFLVLDHKEFELAKCDGSLASPLGALRALALSLELMPQKF
jgi:hypothetical protein